MKICNPLPLHTLATFLFLSFSAFSVWACEIKNTHLTAQKKATVVDDKNGLIWMRCSMGQEWATDHCNGLSSRLPFPNQGNITCR